MFKVNNKDTTPCSSVLIVNFEQVNVSCVRALTYPNKLLFILRSSVLILTFDF